MKLKVLVTGVAIVGVLAAGATGLWYWKTRPSGPSPEAMFEPAESVEVVRARVAHWGPTATLSGTVLAIQSVTLATEVAGVVTEVGFESGSVVEPGQVLLKLESSIEESDLRAARASVRVTEAALKVAQADLRRLEADLRRLATAAASNPAAVAESLLDQARANVEMAQATSERVGAELDQAKARVDQAEAALAKKTLKAPFKARTGMRTIHPGQYLREGESVAGLQSINDTTYLDFAIPQEYISRVAKGMVVTAQAPMLSPEPIAIKVLAMDAVADPTTRNIRVRSVVDNPDQKLRPGMFVDIRVPVDTPKDYVIVPATAVRRAAFGDHVFVIVADETGKSRARQRFVKLGPSLGGDVIVLEGLKEGDELAAAGSFKLREGVLVMVGPPPSPSGAPGNRAEKPPDAPSAAADDAGGT